MEENKGGVNRDMMLVSTVSVGQMDVSGWVKAAGQYQTFNMDPSQPISPIAMHPSGTVSEDVGGRSLHLLIHLDVLR